MTRRGRPIMPVRLETAAMLRHPFRSLAVAGMLTIALSVVEAAGPVFWQVSTRADLLKGELSALSVDADGRLLLGPSVSLLDDPGQPYLWTAVEDRSGSLFVGSGKDGKVFRVDRSGKAALFFDAAEPEVHALALLPDGNLLVATAPDGRIYKVDPQGRSTAFFDPSEKYIWALAVDRRGTVLAGTGAPGVVYRITPDGKGTVLCKAGADNVVSLALDSKDRVLATTGSPGKVVRVDAGGRLSVLLDTGYREARGLQTDDRGNIFVVALDGTKAEAERVGGDVVVEPTKTTPTPSVTTEVTSFAILDMGAATAAEPKTAAVAAGGRPAKGALFRIQPDGAWDTLWESPDDLPMDLLAEPNGDLIVATGNQGKLFRVTGDPPRATWLAQTPAQQVTRLMAAGSGGYVVLTANPGKLLRLGPQRATTGTYESDVRDTQTVSTWGTISWRATLPPGAKVELFTRSGNTSRPDETWSDWGGPYRQPGGEPVTSPRARYLQWKAVLTGGTADSPALTSVSVAYLQRNLRPRVTSITVQPPGVVFQKPYPTGELEIAGIDDPPADARPAGAAPVPSMSGAVGRRAFQKGLQTIQWKGEDPNDDRLRYDVLYRPEGQAAWKTLKRGLADTIVVWDTSSVPNGSYVVRVVASDAPSNPPGSWLAGDMDSTTFEIDNTPPWLRILAVRRDGTGTVVEFEVTDADSALQRVDYSLDAEPWLRLNPKDGMCDSRREVFELRVEANLADRTLVLRAVDGLGNVGTARVDAPPAPGR